MKKAAIVGGAIVAAALGIAVGPAEALTTCSSGFKDALNSTLTLQCGGFSSAHRANGGADKHVLIQLISATGPASATSVGVDTGHTATGVNCSKRDTDPAGGALRSIAGGCDGTAHPLAGVFGSLAI